MLNCGYPFIPRMRSLRVFDDDIQKLWEVLEQRFQKEREEKLYYCHLTGQSIEYIMKQSTKSFNEIKSSYIKVMERRKRK